MSFSFMEQMEENVRYSLIYPYHIEFEKLLNKDNYNKNYPDAYHCHSFEEVLQKAYLESKAFYLTDSDKIYYSSQELEFIKKVIEDETEKINKGYKLTTLDFTEETLEMLNQYKKIKNMTFEEAVTDILMTVVKNPDILGSENNG